MNDRTAMGNALWSELLIEELIRNGVDWFFIAPGSRSAPLTRAAAQNRRAHCFVHYDERGLAFCALGWARAAGRPAAIICTSGTAVANLFPAVVEASSDNVPLILLTADRPPELQDCGANQTIDQTRIFGGYVRQFVELPCPDDAIAPEFVLTTADEAVTQAVRAPSGPVHLNCMFREPLTPEPTKAAWSNETAALKRWRGLRSPYTRSKILTTRAAHVVLDEVAWIANQNSSGLLIAGRLKNAEQSDAVRRLAGRLDWTLLSDVASGVRLGSPAGATAPFYDMALAAGTSLDGEALTVLHIGGAVTSKRLLMALDSAPPQRYFHIADHPKRIDPSSRVTDRIEADIVGFCDALAGRLSERKERAPVPPLAASSETANACLERVLDGNDDLSEPGTARLISRHIEPESGLFLGSSMPIRDMDMFAVPDGPPVRVACNRGASGIDGTVAAACGFALGLNAPTTVVLGDLALLHDLNSLALTRELPKSLVIVALNNDGGGIFSFLPIARHADVFEPFFAAPHGLNFRDAAAMFELEYAAPGTAAEFTAAYRRAQLQTGATLIEVTTERSSNHRHHSDLIARIGRALREE